MPHAKFWRPHLRYPSVIGKPNIDIQEINYKFKSNQLQLIESGIVTSKCPMNFDEFPFDDQECEFVIMIPKYKQHLFKLEQVESKKQKMESSEAKFDVTFGKIESKNGTRVGFKILFKRKNEFHLMSMYLPSIIFVIISWIRYNIIIIQKRLICRNKYRFFLNVYSVFWYLRKLTPAELVYF